VGRGISWEVSRVGRVIEGEAVGGVVLGFS
jgi:hypothetical protein